MDDSKGRRRSGLFVAEGTKCVLEMSVRYSCRYIFALPEWFSEHCVQASEIYPVGRKTLSELTRLQATPPVIAYFDLPNEPSLPSREYVSKNLIVALDRIQDPGNMGTILRCCDWMGVHHVVASIDTVDAFNPKAVQASMGALARVAVTYAHLPDFLVSLEKTVPVYGTFLDGENIYTSELSSAGVLIMGNEGRGISHETAACVSHRLLIPSWPPDGSAVESLNVGAATAIALSQFRMRHFII